MYIKQQKLYILKRKRTSVNRALVNTTNKN